MSLFRLVVAVVFAILAVSPATGQVPLETGTFWESTEQDQYSTGMVWRDADNDGDIDLFIANGNDIVRARNFIYISRDGDLATSGTWMSSNYEYTGHGAVGDIDDNGIPDFLVANYLGAGGFSTANRSNLYLNPILHDVQSPDWYTGDSIYSFSCALGDVDGDGDLDAAFATGDGYTPVYSPDRVYFNVDGQFETLPGWQTSAATAAVDITWGDVNNDGWLDLAVCRDFAPTAVYYNLGGTLETTPSW